MTRDEAVGNKSVEVYPAVIPPSRWGESILGFISLCVIFLSVVYIFLGAVTGNYRGLSSLDQHKRRTNPQAHFGVLNVLAMFTPGQGIKFGLVRIVNNAENSHTL